MQKWGDTKYPSKSIPAVTSVTQDSSDDLHPEEDDSKYVFLYPNVEGGRVFIKSRKPTCEGAASSQTSTFRTEFNLPVWIIANIHKYSKASKAQIKELETESARVAQQETLQKILQDLRSLRKDLRKLESSQSSQRKGI